MQFTLRQKLLAIYCIVLLIGTFIGIQSINRFNELGKSIDVILRENYRSVIYCQQMKENLERIDSGLLFFLLGYEKEGKDLVLKNSGLFRIALNKELHNLTLPDEPAKAYHIQSLFNRFNETLIPVIDKRSTDAQSTYLNTLFPLFKEIKKNADDILRMNQQNMNDANNRARVKAARATRDMYIFLTIAFLTAVAFMWFSNRWILKPIQRLIRSVQEITMGNLNLVVKVETQDEIGHLSETINLMVTHLRLLQRSDQSKMVRIENSTREAFKNLSEAIAIVNLDGTVEIATESAQILFGLIPDAKVSSTQFPWLPDLFMEVLRNKKITAKEYKGEMIQAFIDNREKFFQPRAVPIFDNENELNGLIINLEDVTTLAYSNEMKKDLLSTISHELKTPLTSIRMAIHLLLDEKIGNLNEKQADLLISARDESERLFAIVENLLDIGRIESGKTVMNFAAVPPNELIEEAVEPFVRKARDKGITLEISLPDDLPNVQADRARISYVLGNLLSNALKFTPIGGSIRVKAEAENDKVNVYVSDTGKGIPEEFHSKVFEKFFQIPGQETSEEGQGLGLAIARQIINAHDGEISFESKVGKGTTFKFSLKQMESAQGER
ncbi:MAG: ATP-binding protein [Candidatus Omnitrophota bacterium]